MILNNMDGFVHQPQGRVVIFNPYNRRYYDLDAVAAFVWNMIQQPRTLSELRDAIVEVFGFEHDYGEHDVQLLLQQMEAEGLIEAKLDELAS